MKLTNKQKQIIIKILQPLAPKYVGVFGSFNSSDSEVPNDLDLLVDFGSPVGYEFYGAAEELESKLGFQVDLQTPRSISKRILPFVENELEIIYGSKN